MASSLIDDSGRALTMCLNLSLANSQLKQQWAAQIVRYSVVSPSDLGWNRALSNVEKGQNKSSLPTWEQLYAFATPG
jgi:hypothetical protein